MEKTVRTSLSSDLLPRSFDIAEQEGVEFNVFVRLGISVFQCCIYTVVAALGTNMLQRSVISICFNSFCFENFAEEIL